MLFIWRLTASQAPTGATARGSDCSAGATRAAAPTDITPAAFFTEWVPARVEADSERQRKLGDADVGLALSKTPTRALRITTREPTGSRTRPNR